MRIHTENQHSISLSNLLVFSISLLSLIIFLALPGSVFATDHSGTISTNETWLMADNPHVVVNNVTVNAGVTLTIENGAEVNFESNRNLTVRGTLTANATPSIGIVFSQNTASNWYGLSFQGGGGGSLEWCTIANATYGITLNTTGTVSVESAIIRDGTYGVNATNGTLEFTNVLLSGNSTYGYYGNGMEPTFLDANTIFENSPTGVYLKDISALDFSSPVTIRNTTTVGLQIINCDNPTINNVVFEDNIGTYGAMFLQNSGEFTLGAGNSIGGTGLEASWPVTITAGSYPSSACVIPTTGNANNNIQVYGGSSDRIGTWRLFSNLNYVVTNSPTIAAGGQLTIIDGVEVEFTGNRNLTIRGTLMAIGTPDTGIMFTQNTTSAWYGLSFQGGGGGTITNSIIEYATYGLTINTSGTIAFENSTIRQGNYGINATNGTLELTNVLVTDNSTYGYYSNAMEPTLLDANTVFENCPTGVYLGNISSLDFSSPVTIRNTTTTGLQIYQCDTPYIDNVTLENNTGTYGAIYFQNSGDFTLGAENSIGGPGVAASWPVTITAGSYPSAGCIIPTTGNSNNNIQVYGGSSDRIGTWRFFSNLNYVVTNSPTIAAGGQLTIVDGVEVEFTGNRNLTIRGTLMAIGTPDTGIMFTQNTASAWYGLSFQGGGGGTIENCLIDHATYGLTVNTSGTVAVENTTIADGNYGINATNGTLELTNVLVTGNSTYGFHGNGMQPTFLDANTVFEDCPTGVYLTNISSLDFSDPVTIRNTTTTGLQINNCNQPTVDNSTFEDNTGTFGAIYLQNCGDFHLGAGNSIGGTGVECSWPVTITAGSYPDASCIIPTSGNAFNNIQVYGGSSDRTGTWRLFTGLDYIVTSSPTISAGGQLTIEDGVGMHFASNRNITVRGSFLAPGTPGTEILFTQDTASAWYGLSFQGAGHGSLENCIIENATYGLTINTSGTVAVINSTIRDGNYGVNASNGTLELTNVLVTGNSTFGFHGNSVAPTFMDANTVFEDCPTGVYLTNIPSLDFSSAVTIRNTTTTGLQVNICENPTVNNVIFEDNTGTYGAIYIQNCGDFNLDAGNSIGGTGVEASWPVTITAGSYPTANCEVPISGNANNNIQVYGGSSDRLGTWRLFNDLDYVVSNSPTISAGGQLTIEDGVNVLFAANRNITVRGFLSAEGTAGNGILFTQNTASDWYGLSFQGGGGGDIANCIIEDATYGINANTTGTVAVSSTTIREGNYGVNATNGNLEFLHSYIIDNSGYGFYVTNATLQFGTDATEWNDIYGNGTGQAGRNYRNGPNDVNAQWVYWGSENQVDIEFSIWHELDDEALGLVNYLPYATEGHDPVSGVEDLDSPEQLLPRITAVYQNFPNPFNPMTKINFDLHKTTLVQIQVFDISGARVATLVDRTMPAGHHRVVWNGRDHKDRAVSSGVYLYQFRAGNVSKTQRMMLVR